MTSNSGSILSSSAQLLMNNQGATQPVDELLLPYLHAADQAESERLLTLLISEHAESLVRSIIRRKLRVSFESDDGRQQNQDALEIRSEVYSLILSELHRLKTGEQDKPITNFRSYLAVVAYHACYKYLRRKYPRRHSLKNKLRYLLTHHDAFAVWQSNSGEWHCGVAAWQDRRHESCRAERLEQIIRDVTLAPPLRTGWDVQRMPLVELVTVVFNEAGEPVELDDLVNTIAELQGIRDQPARGVDDDESVTSRLERVTDSRPRVDDEMDQQIYLRHLWTEIRQLPPRQRAALLLNLRDGQGRDVVFLLPLTGVATMREIAATLDLPVEELATLWNELPLDDARIATRLGATRQQVINLRKSARERLARRMKGLSL